MCFLLSESLYSQFYFLAGSRKIPSKNFRIGIVFEPGIKLGIPVGFHGKVGIALKFKEKLTLIPYVGMFPDQEEMEWWGDEIETWTTTVIDAGLTVRYEFMREVVRKSTNFEYDVDNQEFLHHYYYTEWRLFGQVHLGTFIGAGGGIFYYINGITAIGLSADLGYNLTAKNGFAFIPKLVVLVAI
jgi:hypothetical protein